MTKLTILCIDDQRDVLASLRKDLTLLNTHCRIECCESADEAAEVLDDIDTEAGAVALIVCDHVMPGRNGVEFLTEFNRDVRFPDTPKILLTGMATHQDTITAINEARIDRYIEKPWELDHLIETVKILLTRYVLQTGMDYQDYLPVLHQQTLYEAMRGTP